MKRPQIIGFSIALGAAVLAYYVASSFMQPPAQVTIEKQVDSTQVLAARTNIPIGQSVNEGNFHWISWPSKAVSPDYITKASGGVEKAHKLIGSIARQAMLAGEPITAQKLVKPGQGGVLAAILPKGMRAVSTKIRAETAAGNLILPNDHVDVILIRRIKRQRGTGNGNDEETVADTLFRNVRVIAIGQQIETKDGKKSVEHTATTATLEVTPRQAEMLALANSLGEVTLSLRSISDLNAKSESASDLGDNKDRNNFVGVVRYGISSRVYGVN
jgi:pilus assembly protein CpaB